MALNLYDLAGRVTYGDFVPATATLLKAIFARAGLRSPHGLFVQPSVPGNSYSTGNEAEASVYASRNSGSIDSNVVLVMPGIDPELQVSGDYARTLLAMVVKEAGAVIHSSPYELAEFSRQFIHVGGDKLFAALEDYFLLRRMTRPGNPITDMAPDLFGRLIADTHKELPKFALEANQKADPVAQGVLAALASSNRHGNMPDDTDALRQIRRDTLLECDPRVIQIVQDVLDKLDAMDDVLRLDAGSAFSAFNRRLPLYKAALDALLQANAQPQPPQAKPQRSKPQKGAKGPKQPNQDKSQGNQDKSQGDADQGQGNQGQGDQGTADQGDQGDGQGNQGDADQDADQGDGDDQGDDQDDFGDSQGNPGSLDKAGAAKGLLDKMEAAQGNAIEQKAPQQSAQQERTGKTLLPHLTQELGGADTKGLYSTGSTKESVKQAAQAANARAFADAARRALKTVDTTTSARRLLTGRMDRRALSRASMGAQDVMTRKSHDQGIVTSVMVMIDLSSSMSDAVTVRGQSMTRVNAVLGMAAVLVPAIERAGAEVAIGGFTTALQNGGVAFLKNWSQRAVSPEAMFTNLKFGNIECAAGTPMVAPLMWSERQLTGRRATRRVAIWLCDGQPSAGEIPALQYMFQRKSKVEHVGIGLQCDLSNLFGAKSAFVGDMGELARAFERLLIPKAGK